MIRRSRCVAALGVAWLPAAIVCAPSASADPPSSGSGQAASTTIDGLQAQGYNVQINWVNGFDTKPLSECRVTAVNNPGDAPPPTDGTFTTVYVDVACPNGDDGSFGFGAGVG